MKYLRAIFGLDGRSLALFRVLMGVLLWVKILQLWPDLGLIFADNGLLPRTLLAENTTQPWQWLSVYAWGGSSSFVHMVAVFHLGVAVAFILGWQMRWMTILLWFLTFSLNMRNPMILNGGDKVMTVFLFWGMFLPLGSRLSLDGLRKTNGQKKPSLVAVFGGTCFVLQLVALYVLSGYAKSHAVWCVDHSAVRYALMNEAYVRPLGTLLLGHGGFLRILAMATLFLEQVVIFLILCPVYSVLFRVVVPLLFAAFHLGIALTLDVGLFSYACVIVWVALLPGEVFDWMRERIFGLGSDAELVSDKRIVGSGLLPYCLAGGVMVYMIVGTIWPGKPKSIQNIATAPIRALRLTQFWNLYAPSPSFSTRWFAIQAIGDHSHRAIVYPRREAEITVASDDVVPNTYPVFYLRKYFYGLARKNDPKLFEASLRAFEAYWLPGVEAEMDWEVVSWTKRYYPEVERNFTRKVLYSQSRGKTTDGGGPDEDEGGDQ